MTARWTGPVSWARAFGMGAGALRPMMGFMTLVSQKGPKPKKEKKQKGSTTNNRKIRRRNKIQAWGSITVAYLPVGVWRIALTMLLRRWVHLTDDAYGCIWTAVPYDRWPMTR